METITFYSYKGGVGRTLALANIAVYLSRFNQNVCMMDFDLEAPGLHYKFPKLAENKKLKNGLVDYIYEFISQKSIPESIRKYIIEIVPKSNEQGEILLMPAGDVLSPNYWQKLASIDWQDLVYNEENEGIPFFLELKEKIKEDLKPDFLLIDSRTGVTEMGGLCTALLADRVVFLITNNRENIEGAIQIYNSIKNVKRLAKQMPIKVTFVLTRVPTQKDEDKEKELINNILSSLNIYTTESKIEDICILHSDRELELSESLRIQEQGINKDIQIQLIRDYLRLFSRVIPNEVIVPKLECILNDITNSKDLLEAPERTQSELESFVATYKHPKSLERLINLYLLRKESRDKILTAFHDLWRTFGIENKKLVSRYVQCFMTWNLSTFGEPDFEPSIIEEYLSSNPEDKYTIEKRLAQAYAAYDKPMKALDHYILALDAPDDKPAIIEEIIKLCIKQNRFDKAETIIDEYPDIIDLNSNLKCLALELMQKKGDLVKIRKLLSGDSKILNVVLSKNLDLYIKLIKEQEPDERIISPISLDRLKALSKALKNNDEEKILRIGDELYRNGNREIFECVMDNYPNFSNMIRHIRKKYER